MPEAVSNSRSRRLSSWFARQPPERTTRLRFMRSAARRGDWVLVHAGFALNTLDEQDAMETWRYLKEANLVDQLPAEAGGSAESN